uniref:Glycerol kinase n=1 Tax=Rhodosorus marinus TaxID=101924 RepID=A0A7S2ZM72_9RHOD|mmetsp:Transcript_246/g.612  ORF Transcript_246/g.612 Transcript_246/m.612 type:complete len:507 (+) Transcript_246:524-2044(+)|eukprot:CAMPEP_0113960328 /NCGR_PEP_ID=MMETSP0011_2-20120614/4648_1 /TAXON_ID=101924 /ORGANISM="Rhodosorus marinus" /LENGTH=506 /DNA_ID=CAMNT_0000971757 /DNA_START=364 /DNA_END=1884 /DNA_ORIENTATION=+ /assembly_acc=CAM_ASM_000156
MKDLLAYDLGGSSLRLGVVSDSLQLRKLVRFPLSIAGNGYGEYDAEPCKWWRAFEQGCERLLEEGYDLRQVSAVVGCGFTRTQVPLDDQGNVVHPAITFQDSRGATALQNFLDRVPGGVRERLQNLSPYHPIARLLWLKESKPGIWRRVAKVIEPKDYLNFVLTGVVRSDQISQGPLDDFFHTLENDPCALDAAGISASICPEKISPFSPVGAVRGGLSPVFDKLVGKPVLCGSIDTWACVLGSGGLSPGVAYGISGTSDVFGVVTETPVTCDGLISVQWGSNLWQLGGPSQGAASRLEWASEQFCSRRPLEDVILKALESDEEPPIFLPYLDGERTPFWDADLRGAFVGVSVNHEARDFVRAVAEGLNFLSRVILERAEQAAGIRAKHVCFSGGLSNSVGLCQLKADILNRPVFVPESNESGLIGSASVALYNSGNISSVAEIVTTAQGTWYSPNPVTQEEYSERFEVFKETTRVLRDISHRLARGRRGGLSSDRREEHHLSNQG